MANNHYYKGKNKTEWAKIAGVSRATFSSWCKEGGIEQAVTRRRKNKASKSGPGRSKNGYTCKEGDIVISEGSKCIVDDVIEPGNNAKRIKAYIKCSAIDRDGKILRRSPVFAGYDWELPATGETEKCK